MSSYLKKKILTCIIFTFKIIIYTYFEIYFQVMNYELITDN